MNSNIYQYLHLSLYAGYGSYLKEKEKRRNHWSKKNFSLLHKAMTAEKLINM